MKFKIFVYILLLLPTLTFGQTEEDSIINILKGAWRWESFRGGVAGLPATPALFTINIVFNQDSADIQNQTITYEAYSDTALESTGKQSVRVDTTTAFMPYSLNPGLMGIILGTNDSTPVDFAIVDPDFIEFTHKFIADDFTYAFRRDSFYTGPGGSGGSGQIDSVTNILSGWWRWDTYEGGIAGMPPTPALADKFYFLQDAPGDSMDYQIYDEDQNLTASGRSYLEVFQRGFFPYCLTPGLYDYFLYDTLFAPAPGCVEFSGPDTFKLTWFIPDGYEHTLVRDTPGSSTVVWPGDADSDGIVNNLDIIALGQAFGSAGTTRLNATLNWVGQPSADWNDTIFVGTDKKHCDTDGDGMVDFPDINAISQNYGLTHAKSSSNGRRTDPPLYMDILNDTLFGGDTLHASINLGNLSIPADDVYGLAFTIGYDAALVKANTVTIDLDNSWIANTANKVSLIKDFASSGDIDVGYSRIDQMNVSGYGEIGRLSYVIIDNLDGKDEVLLNHVLSISDVKVLPYSGVAIPVLAYGDTVILKSFSTGLQTIDLEKEIILYPNPANDLLYINSGVKIDKLIIADILGKQIDIFPVSEIGTNTVTLDNYPSGLYYLSLHTDKGIATRKIVIAK